MVLRKYAVDQMKFYIRIILLFLSQCKYKFFALFYFITTYFTELDMGPISPFNSIKWSMASFFELLKEIHTLRETSTSNFQIQF